MVIFERSPPTSAAVGVWIFGAFCPAAGYSLNSPTTALGSSVPLISPSSLDQRRDPPLAVAGEVDLGRVDDAGRRRGRRPVVLARKAGWVARLSIVAGKGPTAGWSSAFASALATGLCCPASTSRPAFGVGDLGEVERHFGVGDLGAVAFEDAERVAVLALVEDHRGRRDDQFGGAVGGFDHLARGSCLGAGEVALRRRRAALGAAGPGDGRVGRAGVAAAAGDERRGGEQAGESAGRGGAARIGGMLLRASAGTAPRGARQGGL